MMIIDQAEDVEEAAAVEAVAEVVDTEDTIIIMAEDVAAEVEEDMAEVVVVVAVDVVNR